MAILGIINARPHENHVGRMQLGQTAYIAASSLIITRQVVFLDLLTQIILEKDFWENANTEHVAITRIGSGTTEDDFEIDTSVDDNYTYMIQGDGVFYDLMDREQSFIVFNHNELIVCISSNVISEEESSENLEELSQQLADAVREERFEEAAELRKKIAAQKNQKAP